MWRWLTVLMVLVGASATLAQTAGQPRVNAPSATPQAPATGGPTVTPQTPSVGGGPTAGAQTPSTSAPTINRTSPATARPSVNRCPAGMSPTGDGYCIAADQAYCGNGMVCTGGMVCQTGENAGRCLPADGLLPNTKRDSVGRFMISEYTDCGGGLSCPPGDQCVPGGRCMGLPRVRSTCGMIREGWLCAPNGHEYSPRYAKLCGTNLCNVLTECGPNGECLLPYRQVPAMAAR